MMGEKTSVLKEVDTQKCGTCNASTVDCCFLDEEVFISPHQHLDLDVTCYGGEVGNS